MTDTDRHRLAFLEFLAGPLDIPLAIYFVWDSARIVKRGFTRARGGGIFTRRNSPEAFWSDVIFERVLAGVFAVTGTTYWVLTLAGTIQWVWRWL
ncbi:hypothetical protein GCM10010981_16960 [Dyella nitratireducens]|uniref:Uncharacterized protein n=1 Tax=Dyella nitratireducens TaxID=1849580 RepID=A0ABQ1FU56_9GAMM|nr:hypothetical protein GCM10010981_16960 [Dyella nitratireducens]